MAHHPNVAGGGSEQAGNAADGSGFAGAVRAEQTEDLARPSGKGNIFYRGDITVLFAKLFDFDHGSLLEYDHRTA